MDTPTAIQLLTAFQSGVRDGITGEKTKLDALTYALNLLAVGYQSDQQAIADEVTKQVGNVQAENEKLNTQVVGLNGQLAEASSTIGANTATIADLQIYKDNHPDTL